MADHHILVGGPGCCYLAADLDDPSLVDEETIDAHVCGQPGVARATSRNGHTAALCATHADHLGGCPECSSWLYELTDLDGGPWAHPAQPATDPQPQLGQGGRPSPT